MSSPLHARFVDYPSVIVHVTCDTCGRSGRYRLARLAARYGAEQTLTGFLADLAGDCPLWRTDPRPGQPRCGIRLADAGGDVPPSTTVAATLHRQRQPAREDLPKPVGDGPDRHRG